MIVRIYDPKTGEAHLVFECDDARSGKRKVAQYLRLWIDRHHDPAERLKQLTIFNSWWVSIADGDDIVEECSMIDLPLTLGDDPALPPWDGGILL